MYRMNLLWFLFITILLSAACEGESMNETKSYQSINNVPESTWKKLSEKKIYFGHQSVGYNIVDGIKDVMKENPQIKLNIVETNNPADFDVALFAHSKVGKNTHPKTKNDDFSNLVKNGLGNKADIAFFKYCYVDADANTNVDKVFNDYKDTMSDLEEKFPKTTFIHVTMPLKQTKTSTKIWIKKLIGKTDIWEYSDNIKRNQFNDEIRKEYNGKGPLFDLAKVESTLTNGTRVTFSNNGKTYNALATDYTYDGGHLNEKGRKIVAEQLLILLANLSE